jgi:hypothetical protein
MQPMYYGLCGAEKSSGATHAAVQLVFAETRAVGRQNLHGYLRRRRAKGRSPISGIPTPASVENTFTSPLSPGKAPSMPRMPTAPHLL